MLPTLNYVTLYINNIIYYPVKSDIFKIVYFKMTLMPDIFIYILDIKPEDSGCQHYGRARRTNNG